MVFLERARRLFSATLIIVAAMISGCLSPNGNFSSWCAPGQNCSTTSSITTTPGSLTVTPSTLNADGTSTATVTVTVLDSNSNPLQNKSVTLSSSQGGDVISPSSALTTTSGIATFTISSQHFGLATLTATDTTDSASINSSVTVRFEGYQPAFTTEPSVGAPSYTNLAQPPVVGIVDAAGNVDTSISTGSISLATWADSLCTSSASAATYTGGTISNGSASFSGVQMSTNGFYYLSATFGPYKACSTEIKIGPALSVLHSFTGGSTDGALPTGGLQIYGTALYGMSEIGGGTGCAGQGCGTLFEISSTGGSITILHNFTGSTNDGANPLGDLIQSGGTFYGTTSSGGTSGYGSAFSYVTSYTSLLSFAGGSSDGQTPQAGVALSGSMIYGTTNAGGTSNLGTIYSTSISGVTDTILHSFAGGSTDGAKPSGTLVVSGSTLYGMTSEGGSSLCGGAGCGTIFSIPTSGGSITLLHNFMGGSSDGSLPKAGLVLVGSTLYGVTSQGGTSNAGTIFSISTTGSGFTILHSFSNTGSDGAFPEGNLIFSGTGTTLYGMTSAGGSGSDGTIFSIGSTGAGFTTLYEFQGADGRGPQGDLTVSGSTFYGMTYQGGTSDYGTIFSF